MDSGSRGRTVEPVGDDADDCSLAISADLEMKVVGKLSGGGPELNEADRDVPLPGSFELQFQDAVLKGRGGDLDLTRGGLMFRLLQPRFK